MNASRSAAAILRTLCFFEAIDYAPTMPELFQSVDIGARQEDVGREDLGRVLDDLKREKRIVELLGRVVRGGREDLAQRVDARDRLQARKRRVARRWARWFARFTSIRGIALVNTAAWGYSRDEGDLDFFLIVRRGSLWTTRLLSGLPLKLLGRLPRPGNERDTICLSYWITDDALDLSSHQLPEDDPYFRQWFFSMVPLVDDGVFGDLWRQNVAIRRRHPFATEWIGSPDMLVERPSVHWAVPRWVEAGARWLQMAWFPKDLREKMNRDTRVMVSDQVLKFHVDDARDEIRRRYQNLCGAMGIDP